ncbi:hypothetical protein Bca4012_018152 [Brassica carinata]
MGRSISMTHPSTPLSLASSIPSKFLRCSQISSSSISVNTPHTRSPYSSTPTLSPPQRQMILSKLKSSSESSVNVMREIKNEKSSSESSIHVLRRDKLDLNRWVKLFNKADKLRKPFRSLALRSRKVFANSDVDYDLALVKIKLPMVSFSPAKFGVSKDLSVGDWKANAKSISKLIVGCMRSSEGQLVSLEGEVIGLSCGYGMQKWMVALQCPQTPF